MFKYLFFLLFTFFASTLFAQIHSHNGYAISTKDTLRCLMVFVTTNPKDSLQRNTPINASAYYNAYVPTQKDSLHGITKYFYDASFGSCIVLSDYIDTVFYVKRTKPSPYARDVLNNVIEQINAIKESDVKTSKGYSINSNDFDMWTYTGYGKKKLKKPDGKIDMFIVVFTDELVFKPQNGYSTTGSKTQIKQKTGFAFLIMGGYGQGVQRHEFAHNIVGSNSFHAGGGNTGSRANLSAMGGYSLLSGVNYNLFSVNAWDRWRVGWYPDSTLRRFEVFAVDSSYNYISSSVDSIEKTQYFILRDFTLYGDAVRIKLPYIGSVENNSKALEQWIWIENHQILPGTTESTHYAVEDNNCIPKGIRINYQIGASNQKSFDDNMRVKNHYIFPISSFGNYDYWYSPAINPENLHSQKRLVIISDSLHANPYTGYSYLQNHAYNTILDSIITRGEAVFPKYMIVDSFVYDTSNFFCYSIDTQFGAKADVFETGTVLNNFTNPPTVNKQTYISAARDDEYITQTHIETQFNNNYIYLNGLQISVVDSMLNKHGNGYDVLIEVSWKNFTISGKQKLTGKIILYDTLIIESGAHLILDQGYTPTKPHSPQNINGELIFADNTSLILKKNAVIIVQEGGILELINNSELVLLDDSMLFIENRKAQLIVSQGSDIVQFGGSVIIGE